VRIHKPPCPHGSDGAELRQPPCWTRQPRRLQLSPRFWRASHEKGPPRRLLAAYIVQGKKTTRPGCASTSRRQRSQCSRNQSRALDHPLAGDPSGSTTALRRPARPRWCAGRAAQARTARYRTRPWREGKAGSVLPCPPTASGCFDDPAEVLRAVMPRECSGPGTILTIGETPWRCAGPLQTIPPWSSPPVLARLLCRPFHPTSSLALSLRKLQNPDRRRSVQPRCSWPGCPGAPPPGFFLAFFFGEKIPG